MDLDAKAVLYARIMLDSEWCRRVQQDGELYPVEGSSIENTATGDHSCDWCIASLKRERQARLNMEMSSARAGDETAAVIFPTRA